VQGGQYPRSPREPGRGIYLARRIVAVVVILLLLVLLVPRACQALFGPEEQSNLSVSETTSTTESPASGTENTVAKQEESISDNRSYTSETETESDTANAIGSSEPSTEERGQTLDFEAVSNVGPVVAIPPIAVGEGGAIGNAGTNPIAPFSNPVGEQPREVQAPTNQTAPPPNIASRQQEEIRQITDQSTPVLNISVGNQHPELQPPPVEYPSAFEEPVSFQEPVLFAGEIANGATATATAGATAAIAGGGGATAVAGSDSAKAITPSNR
jgi:hypothetical protein